MTFYVATIRRGVRWFCFGIALWALLTCTLYRVAVQNEPTTAENWH